MHFNLTSDGIVSHRFVISLREDSPDVFAIRHIDLPTASSALVLVFFAKLVAFSFTHLGLS